MQAAQGEAKPISIRALDKIVEQQARHPDRVAYLRGIRALVRIYRECGYPDEQANV